jgi:hypothetical protein
MCQEKLYYCDNPECDSPVHFEPGLCVGCGHELHEYEEHIPEGHCIVEDLDGARYVKKEEK